MKSFSLIVHLVFFTLASFCQKQNKNPFSNKHPTLLELTKANRPPALNRIIMVCPSLILIQNSMETAIIEVRCQLVKAL